MLCTRRAACAGALLRAATHSRGAPAVAVAAFAGRRWGSSNEDPTAVELIGGLNQTKSASTLAVEKREQKIFSMEEYVKRDQEHTDFAKRKSKTDVQNAMDNPIWLLYGLAAMAAVSMYVVMCVRLRNEKKRFDPKMRAVHTMDVDGGPSIGGPFEMRDLDGNVVTDESLKGKWLYIYFGFTNCPDVCPQEMSKMTRVITQLDKKVGRHRWQPLFISIDPRRDTPEAIREYLRDFHPRIMGLWGDAEQTEKCAREYRVYYAVPDEFGDSPDYLIDHSIVQYIMDPNGKFSDYTTKEFTWFESYNKILRRMIQFEQNKGADDPSVDLDIANLDIFHLKRQRKAPGAKDAEDADA